MTDLEFTPAFGNRPTQLIGREPELSVIIRGLDSRPGSKDRAVVMLGQRGYGKTVMLWELVDRARERGFVVASPTSVREGLIERVVEKLQDDGERSLGRKLPRVSGGSIEVSGFSANLEFSQNEQSKSAEYRLTSLCRNLTKRGMGTLILIDELQSNDSEVRRLVGTYQELVGEGLDVAMVLAGLPACVSGVLNDRVLTFLNRARKISVGPLVQGDIDAFYRRAFRAAGLHLDPALRRRASASAEGSPYLMQLIGHYLVSYAEDDRVDERILDEAIQSAVDEFESDICATSIAALSARDCEYLVSMAQLGETCRTADVARTMGVTLDFAQQYRRRLIDAGIIDVPLRGSVRFAIPHLRDYLLKTSL